VGEKANFHRGVLVEVISDKIIDWPPPRFDSEDKFADGCDEERAA
jgi:hypothetical protein